MILSTQARQTPWSIPIIATMRTLLAALLLALIAVAATYTVHAAGTRSTTSLADLTAAGFGLAALIAWPLGTLIFSPRRRHRS